MNETLLGTLIALHLDAQAALRTQDGQRLADIVSETHDVLLSSDFADLMSRDNGDGVLDDVLSRVPADVPDSVSRNVPSARMSRVPDVSRRDTALSQLAAGRNKADVAAEHQVTVRTLNRWIDAA
jgi:hypothetical protein